MSNNSVDGKYFFLFYRKEISFYFNEKKTILIPPKTLISNLLWYYLWITQRPAFWGYQLLLISLLKPSWQLIWCLFYTPLYLLPSFFPSLFVHLMSKQPSFQKWVGGTELQLVYFMKHKIYKYPSTFSLNIGPHHGIL